MSVVASTLEAASVLIVDSDILVRHALADYLRHCGYKVVEVGNSDEALIAMQATELSIDIVICDVGVKGSLSGFALASWVRHHKPELEIRLAGSLDAAAGTAADLCESGPQLARPYDPQGVVDYIKKLRGARQRSG